MTIGVASAMLPAAFLPLQYFSDGGAQKAPFEPPHPVRKQPCHESVDIRILKKLLQSVKAVKKHSLNLLMFRFFVPFPVPGTDVPGMLISLRNHICREQSAYNATHDMNRSRFRP